MRSGKKSTDQTYMDTEKKPEVTVHWKQIRKNVTYPSSASITTLLIIVRNTQASALLNTHIRVESGTLH